MLHCNCLSQNIPLHKEDADLGHLDFYSAGKFLRKVALRVNDVPMKLGINRVIHFLNEVGAKNPAKMSLVHGLDR